MKEKHQMIIGIIILVIWTIVGGILIIKAMTQ